MDENEDGKKRILTPPPNWSEGLKPKSSDESEDDIKESTDWLEEEDFEAPFGSEMDSNSAARPTDHASPEKPRGGSSRAPWFLAILGFVATSTMGGLWLNSQDSNSAEIADLKSTIRSLQREENRQASEDIAFAADNEKLRSENTFLTAQVQALIAENERLKNRDAEHTVKAIAQRQGTTPAKPASPLLEPPRQTGGPWFVNLESHTSRTTANERAAVFRDLLRPLNISVASARVNARDYFRVRAAGFASKASASKASEWMSARTDAGPYWLGKAEGAPSSVSNTARLEEQVATTTRPSPTTTKKLVSLKQLPLRDNWFVFVDTYDREARADSVTSELVKKGLEAKVAVESRSGELFYRVQVVGIESEARGNAIIAQLKDSDFLNARLRKTVN